MTTESLEQVENMLKIITNNWNEVNYQVFEMASAGKTETDADYANTKHIADQIRLQIKNTLIGLNKEDRQQIMTNFRNNHIETLRQVSENEIECTQETNLTLAQYPALKEINAEVLYLTLSNQALQFKALRAQRTNGPLELANKQACEEIFDRMTAEIAVLPSDQVDAMLEVALETQRQAIDDLGLDSSKGDPFSQATFSYVLINEAAKAASQQTTTIQQQLTEE